MLLGRDSRSTSAQGAAKARREARAMSGSRAPLHGVGEDPSEARDRPRRVEPSPLHARRSSGRARRGRHRRREPRRLSAPAGSDRGAPRRRARARRDGAAAARGRTSSPAPPLLSPGDDVLVETSGLRPSAGRRAHARRPRPNLRAAFRGRLRPGSRRRGRSAHAGHAARPRLESPQPLGALASAGEPRAGWRTSPKPSASRSSSTRSTATRFSKTARRRRRCIRDSFVSTTSLTKAYGLGVAALRLGASRPPSWRPRSAGPATSSTSGAPCPRTASRSSPSATSTASRSGPAGSSRRTARPIAGFLAAHPALRAAESRSTLVFPRLEGVDDAGPFVERLFRETGTAVAPGRFFGAPAHFRIAFGGDPAALRQGLEAIARGLARL